MLGGYAATAITAITVQNTLGVHGVYPLPLDLIEAQARAVLDDIGADAIKTGMLGSTAVVERVAAILDSSEAPAVVDPVMVAKGGHSLLAADSVATLRRRLLPMASVLTPNLPEAEALTGLTIRTVSDMRIAASVLLSLGVPAVLLKGGHLDGDTVVDLLATGDGIEAFAAPRIVTRHTHGTGCTTASAVAVGLAQKMTLRDAVIRARAYVRAAIAGAPGYGAGHGPLDHAVTFDPARLN